jgi:SAM-dependent methyltransferase
MTSRWPFLTDRHETVKYEHEFRNMARVARRIGAGRDEDRDEVRRDVFEPAVLTHYDQVQVEMSRYIPIHDYDKYEEKHAYYLEMMGRMIERFRQAFPAGGREVYVAELGAGTGLFTRKLAQELGPDSGAHIDAVELDGPCFYLLDHKMRDFRRQVTCYHRDSRKPLPGSDRCIFTSFADHHIHPRDKKAYFRNIKRHLRPGGLFIVGDEFLRDHDRGNRKEREDALNVYHKHIIQLAHEAQQKIKDQLERDGSPPGPDSVSLLEDYTGYGKLAELEELALKSGLEGREFKLSCAEYEGYLKEAGFAYEKELMGPKSGAEEIGGIYVYVARAAP